MVVRLFLAMTSRIGKLELAVPSIWYRSWVFGRLWWVLMRTKLVRGVLSRVVVLVGRICIRRDNRFRVGSMRLSGLIVLATSRRSSTVLFSVHMTR